MKLFRRGAFVLSIATLAFVGCNSDDQEPQQEPLSRSEYQAAIFDILEDLSADEPLL